LALFSWHVVQEAPRAVIPPECGSWQLWHSRCPAGALLASLAWHVAQAGAACGRWAVAPWQETQSRWPRLTAVRRVSGAWQLAQSSPRGGAGKVCGLWQLVQVCPPACAPLSDAAIV